MKRLNPEHRVNVSVYIRAKDEAAAKRFAEQLTGLIQAELGDWMKWRVTYTGSHVEIEALEA